MPIGPLEIVIIAVVLVVLFGSTQIPKFARSLGEARDELTASGRDQS